MSAAVKDILENEGIAVHLNADCIGFAPQGDDIAVRRPRAGEPEVVGSHLLLAVGRRPNTDDLGLDKAGVAIDGRGYITVDDQLRTNVPGIWALGDCNGKGAFTHTSYNDFEIVAANLLDNDPRRVSDRIPTYALYIDPPLGRAGLTEAAVRKSGRPALVGMRPMTRVGRAVEKGETQGFMKVVVDAETKQILGAAILGVGGDEAIHGILDVMSAKAPYTTTAADHAHPPDRLRADPDHARRDEAAGVSVLRGSLRSHLRMREVGASTPRPLARSMGFRTGEVGANGPHPEVRAKRASKDAPAVERAIFAGAGLRSCRVDEGPPFRRHRGAAREGAFGTEIQGGITGGATIGDKPAGYAPGRLIEGSFAGVS